MRHAAVSALSVALILSYIQAAPNLVPRSECRALVELVYVIDGSDSISKPDYSKQRKALADMINGMEIRNGASRVGMVVYSSTISEVIPLSYDKPNLIQRVMKMKHPRDGTSTGKGIAEMIKMFKQHGRKDVPWVCIVITDGLSKYPAVTADEAKKAKLMGVNMYAVGISHDIEQAELENIASSPKQVLMLQTFDQLEMSLQGLMKIVCPCTAPPPVKYGYVDNGKRSIGSVRSYMCEDGYQPVGNPNITCSEDSIWTTLNFSCLACPEPIKDYGNGYITNGLLLLNTKREYKCKKGYTSPSPLLMTCLPGPNGPYWSDPKIRCSACPIPPPLRYGHLDLTLSDTFIGSKRIYHCDKGYIPTGPIESTCIDDKGYPKWTKPRHGCKACGLPPKVPHAFVDKKGGQLVGMERRYRCNPGYHPTGPIKAICMGEKGAAFWKLTEHFCTSCKLPPSLPHAILQKQGDSLVGSVRTYLCLKGFQPTGPIELKCMARAGSTYWDGPKHRCVACISPPIMPNAILDPSGDTLIGSVRQYRCMKGFVPSGPIEVGCIKGTGGPLWTSPEYQCIACPPPPHVLHAILDPAGDNLVQSKRLYRCEKGYIPSKPGPIIRECIGEYHNKRGKVYWSEPSHYCKACPNPPPMDFATVQGGNSLIGTERGYVCTKGFYATGPISIRCLDDGTWSRPNHTCTACGPIQKVVNAFVDEGEHRLGTIRYFTCKPGYVPDGPPQIECLKNAKWSKANFTCIACKNPYGMKNAVLEPGDNLIGIVRRYTCLPGYLATGPVTSTCALPTGGKRPDWSTPVHYCKDCGDAYLVENAIAVKGQRTIGAVQQYLCKKGYVPSAPPLSHCMPNAEWTPPEFKCIVCGEPPLYEYARVDTVGDTMVGTVRAYTCTKGYIATGPIEVVCEAEQKDGYQHPYWRKLIDNYCKDCGLPPNVTNGYWLDGPKTIGSNAQYVCDTGYVASNLPEIVCKKNGKWSEPKFNCTGCVGVPVIQYANFISQPAMIYLTGSVLTYECIPGYVPIGKPELRCQGDATWSPEFQCILTCNEPKIYSDAVPNPGKNLLGDVRDYTCLTGYQLVGDATVKCLETGLWSARTFECIKCSSAELLPYATPTGGDSLIGSEVVYQCMDGYISDGPVVSVCQSNLTWSQPRHNCYGCITTPDVKNTLPLTPEQSMYRIGTVLTYECISGYVTVNPPILTCQKDGTWSKKGFHCALTCGAPPRYPEALVEASGALVGDTAQYMCLARFKTFGDASIKCLPSGKWSEKKFTCKKCKPAPELEYAVPLVGESYVGSEVAYQCKDGLISAGPVVSMCRADLTWSKPVNACHGCGAPPAKPNAYFTLGKSAIGATRRYSCEGGYDMSGRNSTIVCLPNATWSEPEFTCYVRTTTTTTTPAPKKTDPSVCDGCRMLNGVGYIHHPYDCTQYVQCFFSDRGVEAVYMPCPFGQYWDRGDLTCKLVDDVDCPNERCLNPKLRGYKHSDSTKCCAYWTCIDGKSVAKCCGEGHSFKDGYGCVRDPTCTATCPWEDELPVCDRRALLDKTRYEQHIGDGHWVKMPCAPGTAFNTLDCECTIRTDVIPGYACRPELLLDFDDGVIDDVSGKNVYIYNEGVRPYKGAAYFNGKSRLIINRFSNTAFHGHLVIKLRYKEQLVGPTANSLQALITNGDCGDDPTIIVAKMPGYVLLGAKTDKPMSFALPTIPKEWKEVIYIHDERKLEGKVCGASYNKWSWGPIKSTHCGIQIGYGTKLPNFMGLIDDVTLFQCRPDDDILTVYGGQRATFRNMPPPKLAVH